MRFGKHTSMSNGLRRRLLPLAALCLALPLFAACSYVTPPPPNSIAPASHGSSNAHQQRRASTVVDTALSQLGRPYKWGGDYPAEGFDCSGLVYWAFAQHGVRLPRPSWEQFRVGRPVHREELRPGDLVFFKISRNASYHVGIYTGRGRFVHSPKAGSRVSESSLADDFWNRHYVLGRRVAEPVHAMQ
ncbi:MAG: C40 family peptidase [Desulfovibrionaceae bacterium]